MEQLKKYGPSVQGALGTVLSAKGDLTSGRAAKASANYQARQLEANAGQEIAASTVAAQEEQRKSDLIASRAIAVAAASGGGALDPTVVKILQGIRGEGALASATQLYNGQESARGMRDQARGSRYEGKLYKEASNARALSTILSGGKALANTWGSDAPPKGALANKTEDAWGITV